MLSQAELKQYLSYDPDTGEFTRVALSKNDRNGKSTLTVGGLDSYGYRQIRLQGKQYLAHRLAWLYMTGEWPTTEIDHINRKRDDNRWVNLRLAKTRRIQCQNLSPRNGQKVKNNTGISGVTFTRNRFHVCIAIDGKRTYLGVFDNLLDAAARRKSMEATHFSFI